MLEAGRLKAATVLWIRNNKKGNQERDGVIFRCYFRGRVERALCSVRCCAREGRIQDDSAPR